MALKPEISTELRSLVREVLREVVPAKSNLAAVENVRISNDADLQVFINRLLDPSTQERVKSGKLRFTLGILPTTDVALSGVISEKTINKNAGIGTLVLAADAVLTPLARDRARKLGLTIERRR